MDEHEAVIAQQATRIAELEKFADEANAQMLEAFAERDARIAELEAELSALKAGRGDAVGVFKGAFGSDDNGRLWFKARALGAIPAVGAKLYTAPPAKKESE